MAYGLTLKGMQGMGMPGLDVPPDPGKESILKSQVFTDARPKEFEGICSHPET